MCAGVTRSRRVPVQHAKCALGIGAHQRCHNCDEGNVYATHTNAPAHNRYDSSIASNLNLRNKY
jgi:hypothetical protein